MSPISWFNSMKGEKKNQEISKTQPRLEKQLKKDLDK